MLNWPMSSPQITRMFGFLSVPAGACAQAGAEARNFARAAEALHMTQPALSRSIAGLETTLGERLFSRDPKASNRPLSA